MFGLSMLLISILGCSFYNPLASRSDAPNSKNSAPAVKQEDKTLAEKAVDTTVGEDAIGVPECDELLNAISTESSNQTDGYVAKATREFFLNRIRESVKKSLEENKSDKAELAKNCKDYQRQLNKFKAEEESKKSEDK